MKFFGVLFALSTAVCASAVEPGEVMSREEWVMGSCSKYCGGGDRIDTRTCLDGDCLGHNKRILPCNTRRCRVVAEECGSVLQNPDVLPDRNVIASSSATNGNNHYWNSVHLPHNGRLFGSRGVGGWAAGKKEVGEWIQVDYGKNMTMTGVATQGRGNDNFKQWVTEYTVSYKADGSSTFETIKDGCEKAMVFKGNDDKVEIVVNKLPRPITARYFRINPIAWNGWIVMRFDFLNC